MTILKDYFDRNKEWDIIREETYKEKGYHSSVLIHAELKHKYCVELGILEQSFLDKIISSTTELISAENKLRMYYNTFHENISQSITDIENQMSDIQAFQLEFDGLEFKHWIYFSG